MYGSLKHTEQAQEGHQTLRYHTNVIKEGNGLVYEVLIVCRTAFRRIAGLKEWKAFKRCKVSKKIILQEKIMLMIAIWIRWRSVLIAQC